MRLGRFVPVAGLLGLAFLGLGTTAPMAEAQQTFAFKYTDYNPPDNFITNEIVRWSKEMQDKSGGRIKIDVFPSSQMGPVPRQYDLVRTGVADFGFILLGSTPGRFPLTELSQLPGLFPNAYTASVAIQETYPKFLTKEYTGVKMMYFFTGPAMPTLTKKPIHVLADAKGMRIRQPDTVHARLIEALGAAPVGVDPTEVSDALNKGTIDGVMMGYSGVTAFQLHHVAKYSTEWNTGVVAFAMVMNQDSYNKLPDDLKKIIDDSTGLVGAARGGAEFDRDDKKSRAVSGQAGVQFIEATPDVSTQLQPIAAKLENDAVASVEAKGLPGKDFVAALKASRDAHAHDPAPALPDLP